MSELPEVQILPVERAWRALEQRTTQRLPAGRPGKGGVVVVCSYQEQSAKMKPSKTSKTS